MKIHKYEKAVFVPPDISAFSLITDLTFDIGHTVVDHDGVLLQPHFLLLKLTSLLFQEGHLVQVILL